MNYLGRFPESGRVATVLRWGRGLLKLLLLLTESGMQLGKGSNR